MDLAGCSIVNKIQIVDGQFFKLIPDKCSATKLVATCVKCEPENVQIKGHRKSSSNFLCHLRRVHGEAAVAEYNEYVRNSRSAHSKQNNWLQIRHSVGQKASLQRKFDANVFNFTIQSMAPVGIVDDPYFKKIFEDLNISSRGLNIISIRALTRKMITLFEQTMEIIKEKLKTVTHVCTSADIWSGRRYSFLRITVHWLNEQNLERESAAIACRRFLKGKHSAATILKFISEIHNEFGINPPKIRATLTDNEADFLKAFREYTDKKKTYDLAEDYVCQDADDSECSSLEEGEEQFQNASISSGASCSKGCNKISVFPVTLPNHIKCCANLLNLCALEDVKKAIIATPNLSSVHQRVMKKCNQLWQAANILNNIEVVQDILGCTLTSPKDTRWNSLYDSLQTILQMRHKSQIVSQALNLNNGLTEDDFDYLKEHLECAKPVAEALDILQDEQYVYYGTQISVLFALLPKLENLNSKKWEYCKPIAQSFLDSLLNRFKYFFHFSSDESMNAAIAAISHPAFKNRWMVRLDLATQNKIMLAFTEAVTREVNALEEVNVSQKSNTNSGKSNFFHYGQDDTEEYAPVTEISNQILQFLNDDYREFSMLDRYPAVKQVFLKYNTPLPSSAPVERLFTYETMMKLFGSSKLDNKTLETRVLLKANSHFYKNNLCNQNELY